MRLGEIEDGPDDPAVHLRAADDLGGIVRRVGTRGDMLLAPAFGSSIWFKNGGKAGILARILLQGEAGPIDGVNYGEGVMPPLKEIYNDRQLADVLNYIGERWHKWGKPIPASKIGAVRSEFAERETPWTHDELVDFARKGGGK